MIQRNHSLQPIANAIRFLSVDAIVKAGEGHQGVPLGMAEIATALYANHLRFNPKDPNWWDRDRVVLSNGHGSMLLYSLLYLTGYEKISLDEITRFREMGSHCAGHPERDIEAGIEVTTGPLGQGIGNAFGMAIAEAYLSARFGSKIFNHYTYAFVGDGCLQEGVGQEMISLAGHLRLGKLILLWDDNRITDDGSTDLSISENVAERFKVADWHVIEVNGHDIDAVSKAIELARQDPRPSMIACRTTIACGIERLQGQRGGHSAKLFPEDALKMRTDLNWPYTSFEVPPSILSTWRSYGERGQTAYDQWKAQIHQLSDAERSELNRWMHGDLPNNLLDVLNKFKTHAINSTLQLGGINLSSEINDLLTDILPERMIGCADLEAPTAHKKRLAAFTAQNPSGAYVHCGVREHVMGSMVNGMAAHGGIIPLSVTYLAFSDYERPALRMAALMQLPSKFIFSHDSIGIGRNGPTHQPVEILASLRAMPNMLVMRPADAIEAAECWEVALQHKTGPTSLIFSRQELPLLRTKNSLENLTSKGAYVLAAASKSKRQVTLLATGSEVSLALQAREKLEELGIATAVVSMPCWELFEQQDQSYRQAILDRQSIRIGIEAAMRFGWDRYVGEDGQFIGMSSFGASGPADVLYTHFNITVDAIVAAAQKGLQTSRRDQQ